MEITIKNVQIVAALSEETTCFTASLYIDGKRVGEVANRGQGGGNEYGFPWDLQKDLNEKAKAATGFEFEPLDSVINDLLDIHELKKEGKRAKCGFPVVGYRGQDEFGWNEIYILGYSSRAAYDADAEKREAKWDKTTPVADLPTSITL